MEDSNHNYLFAHQYVIVYISLSTNQMLKHIYTTSSVLYPTSSVFITQCVLRVSMRHAPYTDSAKITF